MIHSFQQTRSSQRAPPTGVSCTVQVRSYKDLGQVHPRFSTRHVSDSVAVGEAHTCLMTSFNAVVINNITEIAASRSSRGPQHLKFSFRFTSNCARYKWQLQLNVLVTCMTCHQVRGLLEYPSLMPVTLDQFVDIYTAASFPAPMIRVSFYNKLCPV